MTAVGQHGNYARRYELRHPQPARRAQLVTIAREQNVSVRALVGLYPGREQTSIVDAEVAVRKIRAARQMGWIR